MTENQSGGTDGASVQVEPVVRPPKAAHITRLVRIAERYEAAEARQQKTYGNRKKGSARSSCFLDAKAIRAVCSYFDEA
jgi:hypothetical protein